MLTYNMEGRGGAPLYEHLYRCIRQDILSGALAAGEKLPSRRRLAEHLNVSVMTVEGAYGQLEAEGYLIARPRRGFFVAAVEKRAEPQVSPSFPAAEEKLRTWRLDLASNRVDGRRFPVATWARLVRQALSEERETLMAPLPHQGLLELRAAIARDLARRRGLTVAPEQIVVGAGAEYLYLLLSQLLGRETVFAVEDPGYPKIRQVYRACGVTVEPIPLDSEGVDMKALYASHARVAHLSPAHQYPTGLVTTIGRRQALLKWAREREGYLIEDDYDSEFRFSGRPIPALQSIDREGRVIYMNTFSQTISPAMRVGFMVLPRRLLETYREKLGFYACTVPALEQQVLSRFLAGGFYEQHLARMRKEQRLRRSAVLSAFRASALPHRIREQEAGMHFLLEVETTASEEQLKQRGEALGVRLSFLSEYAEKAGAPPGTVVVNYGSLPVERLGEAMALLEEVFRS